MTPADPLDPSELDIELQMTGVATAAAPAALYTPLQPRFPTPLTEERVQELIAKFSVFTLPPRGNGTSRGHVIFDPEGLVRAVVAEMTVGQLPLGGSQ